jgi:hypothetical protein
MKDEVKRAFNVNRGFGFYVGIRGAKNTLLFELRFLVGWNFVFYEEKKTLDVKMLIFESVV